MTNEPFFAGGSEMAARVSAFDWSSTPLGPIAQWPRSLVTTVRLILNSRYPMFLWWGPELTNLYNDGYIGVLGARHPDALGGRAPTIWSDIWSVVGPQAETVLREGRATWNESVLLLMERYGFTEETYFTFSYSPATDDDGGIAGVFCACTEDTRRILGERRLKTLRDLGERSLTEAQSVEHACHAAALTISENAHDLPFALLYFFDPARNEARLVESIGLAPGGPASPLSISLGSAADKWDFSGVLSGGALIRDDLEGLFGALTAGPWEDDHTRRAYVQALARPGAPESPAGFLITGLSPRLGFDAEYRSFIELVAAQIATAIANANAYEEEKRRVAKLAELDEAKTAFFSNVSHEFRTPLTLMLGPLEEVLGGGAIGAAERERLDAVQRNALRLMKLVNALLDFSRIEAGRIAAHYEPVDLAGLTAELASVFRSAIESAGLKLVVDCPPMQQPVYVDPSMWEKIVLNLLSNAFKFTFEGGIEVSLRESEGSVVLAVRDSGGGIPPEELPHVFERFHRVQSARGRTHEGAGIGLSLVKELAKLHGGTVEAESASDRGSTFTVRIPAGKEHLPADRVSETRSHAHSARRAEAWLAEAARWSDAAEGQVPPHPFGEEAHILVADDNADMRDYIRRLLVESGYDVTTVTDGIEAEEAIARRRPDLLLLDVMMPRRDGLTLLERIRDDEQLRTLPVVLLSARAGEEARVAGLQAGADDYLVKPFGGKELLARVASRIEIARLRQEAEQALRNSAAALREADRLKDDFLATLSHELRTPLTSILGWAQLLLQLRGDDEDLRSGIEAIARSARVQSELVEDVLDISRITTGKMRLERRPAALVPVVEAALLTVKPAAEAKKIELRAELDPAAGPVLIDPDRVQQIVWNLLSNAVKFTPSGGRIDVSVHRDDSDAIIEVRDTGAGIPATFLPHIFERFRQIDGSSRRSHSGLGLGLALTKNLVELHGGSITAESEEGKGARFRVVFPLSPVADAGTETAARENIVPLPLGGQRVLVVDDDAATREVFSAALRQHGAEVMSAGSAAEAMVALDDFTPHVVITDVVMAGRDGVDLLGDIRAKKHRSDVMVVAVTAQSREALRRLASGVTFDHQLLKPVDLDELVSVVRRMGAQRGN